ncbi:MAG: hypothetical protein AAGJ81_11880 [Verrucomicrobiota bacterium]
MIRKKLLTADEAETILKSLGGLHILDVDFPLIPNSGKFDSYGGMGKESEQGGPVGCGLRPVSIGLTLLRLFSRPSHRDAPRIEGRGVAGIGTYLDTNPIPAPCAASILGCTITVKPS